MTPSEIFPGGAKAIQKQVQMLQNIDNPIKTCDILNLQSKIWVPSPSGLDDEAVTRSSKRLGNTWTLALPSISEKLSMRRPDAESMVGMVDVVRKRQIPTVSGWTAGGYMVVV